MRRARRGAAPPRLHGRRRAPVAEPEHAGPVGRLIEFGRALVPVARQIATGLLLVFGVEALLEHVPWRQLLPDDP